MTDDKDILQALYAACAQAWARFRKRWKGSTSSDKVHGERDCQVFRPWSPRGFRLRYENRNNCREFLLFDPYE